MIEAYKLLNQALIEERGLTQSGYRATAVELNEVLIVRLSHSSKPDLVIAVRQRLGSTMEVNFYSYDGHGTTETYANARLAADAVLNL
ncbi:hypothetical protein GCM10023189_21670 [Nibrella saemangeumensis]|uniref:Uncharacterized protein n=1 Tax=Nibrella saemangeumensis TaxID=1084526 RepID=A0ABP8MSN3_9BACT